MAIVKVYGTAWWPGCPPAKEFLSKNNIEFTYYDIEADEVGKAEFNHLRDTDPQYIPIKERGKVGIPTIVIDGEVFTNVASKMDAIKAKLGL